MVGGFTRSILPFLLPSTLFSASPHHRSSLTDHHLPLFYSPFLALLTTESPISPIFLSFLRSLLNLGMMEKRLAFEGPEITLDDVVEKEGRPSFFYFLNKKYRFVVTPGVLDALPVHPEFLLYDSSHLKRLKTFATGVITPFFDRKSSTKQASKLGFTRAVVNNQGVISHEFVDVHGNIVPAEYYLHMNAQTASEFAIVCEWKYQHALHHYDQSFATELKEWGMRQRRLEYEAFSYARKHFEKFSWPEQLTKDDISKLHYSDVIETAVDISPADERLLRKIFLAAKSRNSRPKKQTEQLGPEPLPEDEPTPWHYASCEPSDLAFEGSLLKPYDFDSEAQKEADKATLKAALGWYNGKLNKENHKVNTPAKQE